MLKNIRRMSGLMSGMGRWRTALLALTLAGAAVVAGSCGDAGPTSPRALSAGAVNLNHIPLGPFASQTDVVIFNDPGVPLPTNPMPSSIPPGGLVSPGTPLIAQLHVSSTQNGAGLAGPFKAELTDPSGVIVATWSVVSSEQGIAYVQWVTQAMPGPYTLTARFDGSSRTGGDGVTTIHSGSSASTTYNVGLPGQPQPCTVNCGPPCTVNCGPPCTVNCGPPPCTINCTVNKQSQTDVTIFVDNGTPLPPPPGQLPPPVSPAGVAPGTNLIARVHVNSLQGGEGISGPFTGRVLGPDGSISYPWTGTSNQQGIIDIRFQAGALAGNYTMIAVFAGSSRTGPDGITTIYTASSGERSFFVSIPNTPPVANAGPDQSVFRTSPAGVTVTLNGSASSDAQGPIASYQWFEFGVLIATGPAPQHLFALGPHNVMLRVTDSGQLTGQDFVNIQVQNVPPVARAGDDQTLECVNGGAMATLDASGSTDLDGTIIEYRWGASLGPAVVQRSFGLGTHNVLLGVIDNDRAGGNDNLQVTVQDTRAPTIQMSVSPTRIWPANHTMVKVATGIGATDACGPGPTVSVSVTDNEGAAPSDWEIVARQDGRYDVWVRAERNGDGTGRVYTVSVTATDASGNASSQTATVTVPHDNSGGDK